LEGWRAVKIGLMPPREMLNQRIDARTDAMIESGWLAEVRGLLDAGVAQNAKIFDFIGYREMAQVLRGELTMERARTAIQLATRQYAKRQMTWFRKDKSIRWFIAPGDDAGAQRDICECVSKEMEVGSRG
jgi:tRNA dimethylallyltransferase